MALEAVFLLGKTLMSSFDFEHDEFIIDSSPENGLSKSPQLLSSGLTSQEIG